MRTPTIPVLAPILALALLAGCKPAMRATGIVGRTITVSNLSNGEVLVARIFVEGQEGREECVQQVGVRLRPGHSHTVTFFDCGRVEQVVVDSDAGDIRLAVEDDSAAIGNAS